MIAESIGDMCTRSLAAVRQLTMQSLQLLEYLMKSGPEHTMQAVQANIYAIQSLRGEISIDFV